MRARICEQPTSRMFPLRAGAAGAKAAIHEITMDEDLDHAKKAVEAFKADHVAKRGPEDHRRSGAATAGPDRVRTRVESWPIWPSSSNDRESCGYGSGAEGSVAVGVEFGQFGVDVDGDDAEVVDVLAVGRGDVGQEVVGDFPAL